MANLSAPMPSFATPFLKDGLVNEPWYRFLFQLQIRTGGSAGAEFATQDELDALSRIVTAQGKEIDAEGVFVPFNPVNLLKRTETFVVPIVKSADQKGSEVVYAPPYSYDTVAQAAARFASPPAIGNTTPSSGAFTTLSATSTVSGAGFTSLFASPPALGGTAANSGAFTTLSAGSTVSGAGFTALFASPPSIGNTAASSGKFTTLQATSTITPSSTAGVVGTTTNDNANVGSVGEFPVNSASGVALTSGVSTNITSFSLTAGDWDVSGSLQTVAAASTTTSSIVVGISTTSATLGTLGSLTVLSSAVPAGFNTITPTPVLRISIASTTTVYLVANVSFAVSTMTANGLIRARRIR